MSADAQVAYTNRLRELCGRFFLPAKNLPDGRPNPNDHPSFRAEATFGIECMISVARVFKAIETYDSSYILPVIIDLSFGLSENQFWKQHSGVLVPVYKSCLHAAINARLAELKSNRTDSENELMLRQKKEWYSLFVVAIDCLYGVNKTFEVSSFLLQELDRIN